MSVRWRTDTGWWPGRESCDWLSVLALLLPIQLMRWRRADGRARRPVRFDRLSVLCMGAATGWLGASVFSATALHAPARPVVSAGCALV
ncbi:hypothetical protein ACFYXP_29125 [Streptomyces sp. NPDC002466]|uniref:hypothetical protein n=1 Tax=unclassified Streptomyces TaxID=2593676 RepID=UPI0011E897E8|nr:hypothetical protein [Streptomyces sp. sk2.1]TXS81322.1 hypothetical protein EAO76_00730 [Streptomyces sp. sk2.1]